MTEPEEVLLDVGGEPIVAPDETYERDETATDRIIMSGANAVEVTYLPLITDEDNLDLLEPNGDMHTETEHVFHVTDTAAVISYNVDQAEVDDAVSRREERELP